MLGSARASFAVVSRWQRWYPAERQGLVMGIAAAGNSGTVIANMFAPGRQWFGWQGVFRLALLPLAVVLVLFWSRRRRRRAARGAQFVGVFGASRSPSRVALRVLLRQFGALRGLSSFLPVFFTTSSSGSGHGRIDTGRGCASAGACRDRLAVTWPTDRRRREAAPARLRGDASLRRRCRRRQASAPLLRTVIVR
jgi:hypothetical protein